MKTRTLSVTGFIVSLTLLLAPAPNVAVPTVAQAEPVVRTAEPRNTFQDLGGTGPAFLDFTVGESDNLEIEWDKGSAQDMELVVSNGGATLAVFVQGNYAYIGEGARLTILDVSAPTLPTVVGQTPFLPDTVRDVYVSGNYAYVVSDNLRVIDVSDPTLPTQVGFYETPGREIQVLDDIAYIVDGGLSMVDVSDPANPTEIGRIDTGQFTFITHVYVTGTIAYVSETDSEGYPGNPPLDVWDMSDPSDPTKITSFAVDCMNQKIRNIYGSGDLAYLVCGDYIGYTSRKLLILDVSKPISPTTVGVYTAQGGITSIYASDDIAYVADYSNGLRMIDVSNPAHPIELGLYEMPGGGPVDVHVSGQTAYVSGSSSGLWLVDVGNPADPIGLGFYGRLKSVYRVDVSDGMAYVIDEWEQLYTLDVSDPASPVDIGFHNSLRGYSQGGIYHSDIDISGSMAYIGMNVPSGVGLWIVDVSNPASPTQVAFYNNERLERIEDVFVSGDIAYIAAEWDGLWLVDVSNPAYPTEVGFYNPPHGVVWSVHVSQNIAYVAGFHSLRMVDVSNPANPTELGFYDTGVDANPRYVHISGNIAYLSVYTSHGYDLKMVDVSDPSNPREISNSYGCYFSITNIYVDQGFAYIVCPPDLLVLDVIDPANPVKIASFDAPGYIRDLDGSNDLLYVAAGSAGMFVLRRGRPPLSLHKQATPNDNLRNGDTLTYTLTISGPGLSARLRDPLPETVRYVSGSITGPPAAAYDPTAHAVVWEGTLMTGTVETIQFQVKPNVAGRGMSPVAIVNTAWLTDRGSGWSVLDVASVDVVPPSLHLSKRTTPAGSLRNGDTLTYTLTISSAGLNVRLWDPLPPLVRYVPGSITDTIGSVSGTLALPAAVYSPTAHAIVWEGRLPTGTVQTVRFQVVPRIANGKLTRESVVNTARLTDIASGWSMSATASVDVIPPPLYLRKRATPTGGLRNNDTLTYTLTIAGSDRNVRLWDPLPPLVHYVPGSITGTVTPTAVYSPTAHAVVWQGTPTTGSLETIQFQVEAGVTGTALLPPVGTLALPSFPIVNTAWLTEVSSGFGISVTAIVNDWHDDASWHTTTVDSISTDRLNVSLALDSSGRPHIIYNNQNKGDREFKYAWHTQGVWHIETVDSEGWVGAWSSLALDSADYPHVSYCDLDNSNLKYAWYDGVAWHIETVDSTELFAGAYTSLALDDSDRPHISYGYSESEDHTGIKYAWYDGTTWYSETVDSGDNLGWYTSLALDAAGHPHIGYYDAANGDLKYAWYDGTTWYSETVDSEGDVGTYASLALDESGHPHISYYRYYNPFQGDLKYAWHDGSTWHIQTVDGGGNVGGYASLALNGAGQAHVSYYDLWNDGLKHAWNDGVAWHIETVHSQTGVGQHLSIAQYLATVLDTLGRPHISYYDATNSTLQYTHLAPDLWITNQPTLGDDLDGNQLVTHTLAFPNRGINARVWNPLPDDVRYVSDSVTSTVTPAAIYDPTAHAITWEGRLAITEPVRTVSFQVTPRITETDSSSSPQPIVNTTWITDTEWNRGLAYTIIVNGWRAYQPLVQRNTRHWFCGETLTRKKVWQGELSWHCDVAIEKAGEVSLKLQTDTFSIAELYSPLIPVEPGQVYEVSYWAKTDLEIDGADLYGRVIAAQYNAQAEESDEVNENRVDPGFARGENIGGQNDWVFKSYTFTTRAVTDYVRLRAMMGGPEGTARGEMWLDQVTIRKR